MRGKQKITSRMMGIELWL